MNPNSTSTRFMEKERPPNPFDRDPYKTLGVRRDAGIEDVRSAYRKLVRMCHPDVCGRNMENVKRFLAIKDAYQFLRQKLRARGKVTAFSSSSPKGSQQTRSVEGTFLFVQIGISQALYGTTVPIEIETGEDFCSWCKGLGKVAIERPAPCPLCRGKGYRVMNWGKGDLKIICSECSGSGNKKLTKCTECAGRGIIAKKKRVEVEITPGTRDGTILEIEGSYRDHSEESRGGSVFVEVEVKIPPGWVIHGRDIISSVDIDCWTRLGGGYISVETIDGTEKLFVTPGLGGEKFLRIRKKGWIDSKGRRGDHLVRLNVVSPIGPCSKEAMELINKLKILWPCKQTATLSLPMPLDCGKGTEKIDNKTS